MTLKSEAKFKEKLTCGFNEGFGEFHPTTQKSKSFTSMGYFCPKYIRFELQKYIGVNFHDTEQWCKNWINPDLNSLRSWVNFHLSTEKFEKLYIDQLFLSKEYNVSVRKFQRNYVSWQWKVMQILKKTWHVSWKIT